MVNEITEYVQGTVEKIAKERGYNGEITMESNLLSIGVDSLDVMEIVLSAENKFHIRIDDNRISRIETMNELVQLLTTV